MPISFLTSALWIVSVLTNLTVEGIKKILNNTTIKYSSNVIAVIASIVISVIVCAIYLIMNDLVFTVKIGIQIVILVYLGFLVSTVGYDKVVQMINQIKTVKE